MSAVASKPPRVAILGLHLEANRFAPPTTKADFEAECWVVGDKICEMARDVSHLPLEIPGFFDEMDRTGPWEAVPIILAAAQPGGPVLQSVFDEFMSELETRLKNDAPVDAVYVCSHGGSCATVDLDNDGTIVTATRRIVGSDVPIVVTHDLHCAVSDEMIRDCDALVAYRTNPHVDHKERAAEAAQIIRKLLSGVKTTKAFIRLPLSPPGVTLLMDGPYGDMLRKAEAAMVPPVLNVSITTGFVLSDLPKTAFGISVTTENDQALADRLAKALARDAWTDRHRYTRDLLSIERAMKLAQSAVAGATPPVCFADCADNPGGGAPGNTIWMIKALHNARVSSALVGLFCDPHLAEDAHNAGKGTVFDAVFNRTPGPFADTFQTRATVIAVSAGVATGRRGRDAGRQLTLGCSALLQLEGSGLYVIVNSLREQLCDPIMIEMFGLDINDLRVVVLKSRGHFRAGFDEFFPDDCIFELDTPGMTSNVLRNFEFKGVPRPFYPLDPETVWELPV